MKKFEDIEPIIDDLLERRRSRWNLNAVKHVDFDDIKQEIKIHIFQKFDMWNQDLPFENWCATIIHNQIINSKRNLWRNHEKPCSNCYFNCGGDYCKFTKSGKKDESCPEYKTWLNKRKGAYEIKRASSVESEDGEILHSAPVEIDYDKFLANLDPIIKDHVKEGFIPPVTYKIFKMAYLENLSDEEIASKMGYKTKERGRSPGYRILTSHKSNIKQIAKEYLEKEEYNFIDGI